MNLDQQRRYARQIMLPELGEAGQQKLLAARVLVVGAGGLGSALIPYLAAAGVGTLGIIDPDRVELSNLARQVIHESGDIGRLKVESARDRVEELNPDVRVVPHAEALTPENAERIIAAYDVVADGCDNFATRFVVNDACVKRGTPLVSAAIAGWQGQVMSILPGGPTYRDLVHEDAPEANTCRESGVIGPLAGIIGSMQALEVLRVLLGTPALGGKLAIYDGITAQQRVVTLT
ncbi:MAG: molybdopterin biosynthesis protein MoeB [Azospirillum brasilense]|nr:MAG: molybdopterin biosynthesis protein MoeB [Azospirillum brasilense]